MSEQPGRGGRIERARTGEDAGNDSGLVLQAKMGDFSILFPGDISHSGEKQLIGKADPASTMLLSPHHGSKTSNSQAFLSAVHPRFMLVSAGQGRSMFFPHPGLERQCSSHGHRHADNRPIRHDHRSHGRQASPPFRVQTDRDRVGRAGAEGKNPCRGNGACRKTPPAALPGCHTSVKSEGGVRRYFKNLAFSTELE